MPLLYFSPGKLESHRAYNEQAANPLDSLANDSAIALTLLKAGHHRELT